MQIDVRHLGQRQRTLLFTSVLPQNRLCTNSEGQLMPTDLESEIKKPKILKKTVRIWHVCCIDFFFNYGGH